MLLQLILIFEMINSRFEMHCVFKLNKKLNSKYTPNSNMCTSKMIIPSNFMVVLLHISTTPLFTLQNVMIYIISFSIHNSQHDVTFLFCFVVLINKTSINNLHPFLFYSKQYLGMSLPHIVVKQFVWSSSSSTFSSTSTRAASKAQI